MTSRIVHADPGLRRLALGLVLGGSVLGAVAVALLTAYLRQVTSLDAMRGWLWGAVGLTSAAALVCGCHLAYLARRVVQADQFPLPGQRVWRDTPLRQGPAARTIAWLTGTIAAILWAVGLALPVLVWKVVRSLGR